MKITAKLAYSQLKVNRSRTRWTLLAIALSTALTTAVCNFVSSGNAMLVDFLGEDYGDYGQSYTGLLLFPAVVFGILIVAMSVTVISNVFRISAQERVAQFGVMKCTGATKKQITETVMYESIWLCIIGIPVGIVAGTFLALGGFRVANFFLDDLNAMVHIMMNEIHFSLRFVFSWQATLVSMLLSFVIVLYSAWRPAHRSARVSAIECIRGTNEVKIDTKPLRENRLVKRLFGFEGILADKNLKRNRRNFRATVISLSVGVILFVSLGGLGMQAAAIEDIMNPNNGQTVISEYTSNYSDEINATTGREETTYIHPIDTAVGNQITQQLEAFENTDIFGLGSDRDTYYTVLSKEQVAQQMLEACEAEKCNNEFEVEIITLDQENYANLCEKANVPVGATLLINHYSYNDFGHEVHMQPFSPSIKELQMRKADGSSLNMPIDGMLTQEQIPQELFYPNTYPVRLIVANAEVRGFSWYCAPEHEEEFIEYANQVLGEKFGSKEDSSYMEDGFNTRVYRMDEYMKVMNIAISLVSVFMYSFTGLLMLIGLTNVISTLSTNVMMRAKEFAVLKSVGMTPESMTKMLNFESILCSVKASLIGIPVGIGITVLINLLIRAMLPIPYKLPLLSIILCVLVVFFITLGTTRYAARKLQNQNIIESIRAESGK